MERLETIGNRRPLPMGEPVILFVAASWRSRTIYKPAVISGGFPVPDWWTAALVVAGGSSVLPPGAVYAPSSHEHGVQYMDGSHATMLAGPVAKEAPCVGHLRLAPGTEQPDHGRTSDMDVLVVGGAGAARTVDGIVELVPGTALRIPALEVHGFTAGTGGLEMLAYCAESAWGPDGRKGHWTESTVKGKQSNSRARDSETA